ncbi:restriction endonuclease subunit S [Providencia huaxiensis]|uniref:restriction endonuclease subunit S n=1 Tax=Providencia huaxiensis TaxID=2027290 RepID=UPI0034E42718
MSELSYLEKLLDGTKVEWKPIGTEIKTVTAPSKLKSQSYRLTGRLPIIDQGLEFIAGYTDEDVTPVSNGEYIIFGDHSEHIKYVNFPFVQGADGIKILRTISANTKYIYYSFLTFYTKKLSYKRHWSTAQQTLIPIPCPNDPKKSLVIQSEIVRILDKFTALTAELTAELTARKKQYNYYRDQLLSFDEEQVEWKTLSEVALEFGRGKSKHRPRNDEKLYGGDIPFIQTGDIRNASHIIKQYSQTYSELGLKQSKLWSKGTLCITIAANIAETSILGFDACFPDSVIGFVADPSQTSSGYVEYLLQSIKTELEKKGKEKSSAQSNINLSTFEQLKLPFPSLAEQAHIVSILDKFETMVNSFTEGLPREINLRQEQYEYYRNLLFSFPESNVQGRGLR